MEVTIILAQRPQCVVRMVHVQHRGSQHHLTAPKAAELARQCIRPAICMCDTCRANTHMSQPTQLVQVSQLINEDSMQQVLSQQLHLYSPAPAHLLPSPHPSVGPSSLSGSQCQAKDCYCPLVHTWLLLGFQAESTALIAQSHAVVTLRHLAFSEEAGRVLRKIVYVNLVTHAVPVAWRNRSVQRYLLLMEQSVHGVPKLDYSNSAAALLQCVLTS